MGARDYFLVVIFTGIMLSRALSAQEKPESKSSDLDAKAKAFVDLLAKGDFASATKDFDVTMQRVLPAEELKKSWHRVLDQTGAFKKPIGSRWEKADKYDIVYVTCEFAEAKWDGRLVFDKDGKIAGLNFAPTAKPKPQGAEEIWEGKLTAGAIELRMVFHFFKQKDGSHAGTMDSPDQGAMDLVADEVTIKDGAVRVRMIRLGVVFEGKLNKDGQEISGEFKQAGQSFPLTLKKVKKVTEAKRPQTPKKPFPYDEVEVTYENKKGGIKLAGTLTLPRSKGSFPAAILITGSGPQDRDETIFGHKPFLVLADYLTRRGIAVLRVDDRGVGGTSGSTRKSTSADFAEDVLAGVGFLKGRKEINPAQIGLIGHREGGIIAPMIASQSREIAFIVMLAGTGVPGEETLFSQGAAILKVMGGSADELAQEKALQASMFKVVREEKDDTFAEEKTPCRRR